MLTRSKNFSIGLVFKSLWIILTGWTFSAVFVSSATNTELLKNPSFESGINFWYSDAFDMQTDSTHVHGGQVSVRCTGRSQTWQGPAQIVNIQAGHHYLFKSYIKLINDNSAKMFQTAMVKIAFTLKTGGKNYFLVCQRAFLTTANGWTLLGGDFKTPNIEWTQAELYVESLDPGVDFYYDDTSLTEIQKNTNWENEANARIEQIRKSNMHFKIDLPATYDRNDVTIQVKHVKHSFGWGSMVRSDLMIDPDFQKYQNLVYHMFNWVSIQDYKWGYNRGNRTHPDYSVAIAATDVLQKHNVKVRGHCMFWAVDGHNPDWTKSLSSPELKAAVDERIAYMTRDTKNKLDHWDVNNELVHGHIFETLTGDSLYTEHMFKAIHAADPIQNFSSMTTMWSLQGRQLSYLTQIQKFKDAGVGLGGVGVQSHLDDLVEPDPDILKLRLDLLAQPGVPIWITELDFAVNDEITKADWYEKVWRLYFSHPAVDGVILWGFWDHDMDPLKALVHGYSYMLNEAGHRWLKLTKEEWSTHINQSLVFGTQFDVRGFQGNYKAIVWYKGKPIKRTWFHLGKADKTVNIVLTGTEMEIQLPVEVDPFQDIIKDDPEVTSQHLLTLGEATSTSLSDHLQCTTRMSAVSAVGDDIHVEVGCQNGEILTGCTSRSMNNDWHRDLEQMVFAAGRPICKAINGYRSTAGVQAVARCCHLKGLQCTYKTAGPSTRGCSTWTFATDSDGSFFTNTSCYGQNDDPSRGVYGYAACCQGGGIKCSTVISTPGGLLVGDKASITCPPQTIMTGCNVFSQYGRAAGAYIADVNGADICYAVNGSDKYEGETGVQAIATCCV